MRKEDADMFSARLNKILEQYPDVREELEKYVSNRKKIFETMFTKPEEFAETFWTEVMEFIEENAHVKGFVSEMLVVLEITAMARYMLMSSVKEMLELGKVEEVKALLEDNEKKFFWYNLKLTEDEDNNEDNER